MTIRWISLVPSKTHLAGSALAAAARSKLS
jgi:hypothetical protein